MNKGDVTIMKSLSWRLIVALIFTLAGSVTLFAQDSAEEAVELPRAFRLNNVGFELQNWNNCGPATLTNALTFFGYSDNQVRAANYLKPNYEDKNVSPWQMAEFVNQQVGELPVRALVRYGGTRDLVKELLVNQFPVIIEKGYDPEPDRLGWMGHYLLMVGYDDSVNVWITHDSYVAANTNYDYDYIEGFWQHFNYAYIVLYTADREAELMEILGSDADERQNVINALEIARTEATADPTDKFAWFNMGTNFVELEMYPEAAIAYDEARKLNLPWRMLWYQFGMFEAYYQTGRYQDMITLAQANLNDGGGQYVEETYYYGGLARAGLGEIDRAISNFDAAIQFNPNFTPAILAKQELQQPQASGS